MKQKIETIVITELGGLIRTEISAATAAARSAVEHAVRAGELLIEAKAQVTHGEWGSWLETNVEVADRTARTYMALARRWEKLSESKRQRVADLPLRAALKSSEAEIDSRIEYDERGSSPSVAWSGGDVIDIGDSKPRQEPWDRGRSSWSKTAREPIWQAINIFTSHAHRENAACFAVTYRPPEWRGAVKALKKMGRSDFDPKLREDLYKAAASGDPKTVEYAHSLVVQIPTEPDEDWIFIDRAECALAELREMRNKRDESQRLFRQAHDLVAEGVRLLHKKVREETLRKLGGWPENGGSSRSETKGRK